MMRPWTQRIKHLVRAAFDRWLNEPAKVAVARWLGCPEIRCHLHREDGTILRSASIPLIAQPARGKGTMIVQTIVPLRYRSFAHVVVDRVTYGETRETVFQPIHLMAGDSFESVITFECQVAELDR